jgi:hypothetical protein
VALSAHRDSFNDIFPASHEAVVSAVCCLTVRRPRILSERDTPDAQRYKCGSDCELSFAGTCFA